MEKDMLHAYAAKKIIAINLWEISGCGDGLEDKSTSYIHMSAWVGMSSTPEESWAYPAVPIPLNQMPAALWNSLASQASSNKANR